MTRRARVQSSKNSTKIFDYDTYCVRYTVLHRPPQEKCFPQNSYRIRFPVVLRLKIKFWVYRCMFTVPISVKLFETVQYSTVRHIIFLLSQSESHIMRHHNTVWSQRFATWELRVTYSTLKCTASCRPTWNSHLESTQLLLNSLTNVFDKFFD